MTLKKRQDEKQNDAQGTKEKKEKEMKRTGFLALQVEGSQRQGEPRGSRPLEDGKESLSDGDAFQMSRVEIGLLCRFLPLDR